MHIITLASAKGGSGKTTLAGHLAVAAEAAGAGPVGLVDCDPQGSLTSWWAVRDAATPLYARASASQLMSCVHHLRALSAGLVVIDTPPAMGAPLVEAVDLADLVVIPARPSPHDLRAAGATVELVERQGKPFVFVVNAATHRARITDEAIDALSLHGDVAPVAIHQRTGFAASMIDGRSVMELPGERRAADEIRLLWTYLAGRIAAAHSLAAKSAA